MVLSYWINFISIFALGIILVQISHGKILDTTKRHFKFSTSFLKIIRYLGLCIIIYSGYGVIVNYAFYV